MHVGSTLLPLAASALGAVAHQVSGAVESGFRITSQLFAPVIQSPPSAAVSDLGPPGAGMQPTGVAEQTRLEASRQNISALRETFHKRLVERFSALGVDLSEPAVLRLDPTGRVLEVGGHWDRGKIELAFENDPQLRRDAAQLLRQAAAVQMPESGFSGGGQLAAMRLVVRADETLITTC